MAACDPGVPFIGRHGSAYLARTHLLHPSMALAIPAIVAQAAWSLSSDRHGAGGRANAPKTHMTHLATYFGDPVSHNLQQKSCIQTAIKFVCSMLSLMKYRAARCSSQT